MSDNAELYGDGVYGETVYGGAYTVNESPTVTGVVSPSTLSETSGANSQSSSVLSPLYSVAGHGYKSTAGSATFAGYVTTTDDGVVSPIPTVSGSTTVSGSETTTVQSTPTLRVGSPIGGTGTMTTATAASSSQISGLAPIVTPHGTAFCVVTDTEIAEAIALEAADASQSEVATLTVSGGLESVSADTATSNVSADASLGTTFTPGDHTTATLSLTTPSGYTSTAVQISTGVTEGPTTVTPTQQQSSVWTNASASASARFPPTYPPPETARSVVYPNTINAYGSVSVRPESIGDDAPTISGVTTVLSVPTTTWADGAINTAFPPLYSSEEWSHLNSTASQTTGPTNLVAEWGIKATSGGQKTHSTVNAFDEGVVSPSIGVSKPTSSSSTDRTITRLYLQNLKAIVAGEATTHTNATEKSTGAFESLQSITEFGFDTTSVSNITIAGSTSLQTDWIATEYPTATLSGSTVSLPTTAHGRGEISLTTGTFSPVSETTNLNESLSLTNIASVILNPTLTATVVGIQSTALSSVSNDVGIGTIKSNDTVNTTVLTDPSTRASESIQITSGRTVIGDKEYTSSTESPSILQGMRPESPDVAIGTEHPSATGLSTVNTSASAPVIEQSSLLSESIHRTTGWAVGSNTAKTRIGTDIGTIIKADGSVLEKLSSYFGTMHATIERADISLTLSGTFGTKFSDSESTTGSETGNVAQTRTVGVNTDSALAFEVRTLDRDVTVDLTPPTTDAVESPTVARSLTYNSDSTAQSVESATLTHPTRYGITPRASANGSLTSITTPTSVDIEYRSLVEATPTISAGSTQSLGVSTAGYELGDVSVNLNERSETYTEANVNGSQQTGSMVSVSGSIPSLERAVSITDALDTTIGYDTTEERTLMVDSEPNTVDVNDGATLILEENNNRTVTVRNNGLDIQAD